MSRPLVVALTGGIGSGKSTVSKLFEARGVPVIDADVIAREVVAPGAPLLAKVVAEFGADVVDAQGALDRRALRAIVFADPGRRRRLEALLHPRISQVMQQRISEIDAPYCILCIPLLAETGQASLADRVLVVDAPESLQASRVAARDDTGVEYAQAIIATQASRADRRRIADDIIDNRGDLAALEQQVAALHERYTREAARRGPAAS